MKSQVQVHDPENCLIRKIVCSCTEDWKLESWNRSHVRKMALAGSWQKGKKRIYFYFFFASERPNGSVAVVSNPKGTPVPNPRSFGKIVDFRFMAKKWRKRRRNGQTDMPIWWTRSGAPPVRFSGHLVRSEISGLQTLVEGERPNEHFWRDPHAKLNLRVGSDGSPKPQKKSVFARTNGQTDRQTYKQTNKKILFLSL